MDGEDKVRELEEELKLLKAEVKNVLLDLREVVLARANPLARDLDDGAAGGAEAAAEEAGDGRAASAPTPHDEVQAVAPRSKGTPPAQEEAVPPRDEEVTPSCREGEPWPGGEGDIVAWVVKAVERLGPRQVEHLLAAYRLLKPLPPNVGRALAHLQELVRTQEGSWIQALKELDRLASSSS